MLWLNSAYSIVCLVSHESAAPIEPDDDDTLMSKYLTLDSQACIIYASQSYKYEHEFVHIKYICSLCEYATFEVDCHLQTACFTSSLP